VAGSVKEETRNAPNLDEIHKYKQRHNPDINYLLLEWAWSSFRRITRPIQEGIGYLVFASSFRIIDASGM
jgi:hypothetical protein